MIRRFADEKRQVNLAISLHAADDDSRLAMMPVNKRYKLSELIESCRYYVMKTGRRITFEWALILGSTTHGNGSNAFPAEGLSLSQMIPLNPPRICRTANEPDRSAGSSVL
jgi:23S rRNA (adenine2503-C2)-methyltransferase